ncbi:MAG: hypothetical protein N3F62_05985 [Bacteroidia bacterium]|nr:hypothetical protein [Bacteroidia bacterium]
MKSHSEKLTFEKVWKLFQETDKKFQETDKKFQETDRKFKETDKKLRQLENLFVGQWGKLIESLVEGNLAKLLRERGIDVRGTRQRIKSWYDNKEIEIDLLAINGKEVVAVEVKTTLRIEDVNDFIEDLKVFKKAFPEYKDKIIYGSVAFLTANEGADKYAYRKGLFVIKATGESTKILNDKKFKPKSW